MILLFRLITVISLTTLLVACGGGGGGSDSKNEPTSESGGNNQPPTEPAPTEPTPTEPQPTEPTPRPTPDPDPLKSVTLSWSIPDSRTNGDPLPIGQIGGYEVYYFKEGSSQGEGETIVITDPSTNETTTPGLVAGTYYFAIASYDTSGLYSEISDYISASIP